MKIKFLSDSLFLIILFALFLWQTFHATLKYLDGTISTSISSVDDGTILFPSVTVCKKYFFVPPIKNETNATDLMNALQDNTWKKRELFYFVSHANMFYLTFPCNTMDGAGNQNGKPCTFPHRYYPEEEILTTCDKYCATR